MLHDVVKTTDKSWKRTWHFHLVQSSVRHLLRGHRCLHNLHFNVRLRFINIILFSYPRLPLAIMHLPVRNLVSGLVLLSSDRCTVIFYKHSVSPIRGPVECACFSLYVRRIQAVRAKSQLLNDTYGRSSDRKNNRIYYNNGMNVTVGRKLVPETLTHFYTSRSYDIDVCACSRRENNVSYRRAT